MTAPLSVWTGIYDAVAPSGVSEPGERVVVARSSSACLGKYTAVGGEDYGRGGEVGGWRGRFWGVAAGIVGGRSGNDGWCGRAVKRLEYRVDGDGCLQSCAPR